MCTIFDFCLLTLISCVVWRAKIENIQTMCIECIRPCFAWMDSVCSVSFHMRISTHFRENWFSNYGARWIIFDEKETMQNTLRYQLIHGSTISYNSSRKWQRWLSSGTYTSAGASSVCVCCHVDASEKPSVHKTTKVYELMPECSLSLFYAISSWASLSFCALFSLCRCMCLCANVSK